MGWRRVNKRSKENVEAGRAIIVRKCRLDNICWYVPDNLVAVRPQSSVNMARFAARVDAFGRDTGAAVRSGRYIDERDEALRLTFCPFCGQQDWDQGPTRAMPPSVDIQLYQQQQARLQAEQARIQQAWLSIPPPPPPPPPPIGSY